MANYELSNRAADDLFEIALYGIENFGELRALAYRDMLKDRFEDIADHPLRYPTVDHIRKGYRRSVCGVHSIYFRQQADIVEIVRILGRQDTSSAF